LLEPPRIAKGESKGGKVLADEKDLAKIQINVDGFIQSPMAVAEDNHQCCSHESEQAFPPLQALLQPYVRLSLP